MDEKTVSSTARKKGRSESVTKIPPVKHHSTGADRDAASTPTPDRVQRVSDLKVPGRSCFYLQPHT
jgi:hypothetical protein